jgi:hypothetical protein
MKALSPLSEEFDIFGYKLQNILNAPKMRISECLKFNSPTVDSIFSNYVKSMNSSNVVDVFVPVDGLHQSVSEIQS